ncbi:Putative nuclease HARBI1 [Linum perenne]
MVLLSKLAVAQSLLESNRRADPTTIVLPLPHEVYRVGFCHYATKTTDQMCVNMLRMRNDIFRKLCTVLQTEGGLQRSKNMDINEMVAIFLVTIGHNIKNRKAQFLFQRSAETISRVLKLVLLSILKMESQLLAKPTPVPPGCTNKNWKYFPGALGALDGMMVSVRTSTTSAPKYRNRKGVTSINVLGVCNQNLQFIYCLTGWPGSAHDSHVLKDALAREDCFSVPAGMYYLCDAGYTNARGFLAPLRGQRYHLNDWGRNRPRTKEENYNMRHSRARNVIECAFGILKMQWALLRDSSWFSPRMVSMITNACFLLHNFIRTTGGPDIFEQAYIPPVTQTGNQTTSDDPPPISAVESSQEWTAFRNELAETMWASRGRG